MINPSEIKSKTGCLLIISPDEGLIAGLDGGCNYRIVTLRGDPTQRENAEQIIDEIVKVRTVYAFSLFLW